MTVFAPWPTRSAGPDADNLARCRPVTANPSALAVAAVDGSAITAWTSTPTRPPEHPDRPARRDRDHRPGHAHLARRPAPSPYEVQIRGGRGLADRGHGAGHGGPVDEVSCEVVVGDAVRLRIPATASAARNPAWPSSP